MKRILFSLLAMLVAFVLVTPAQATLINRGTDTLGNNLIYDDDLKITWYDFSNAVSTWDIGVAWAAALSVDFGGDTFDDWRLPATVDGPFVFGSDGTTTAGHNITNSEMGHLYYTELGNVAFGGLANTGDFQNLFSSTYWSGTEFAANTGNAWLFFFDGGLQTMGPKGGDGVLALAVRSGDVIPEPTTMALLGIGLSGLAGGAVKRRFKRVKK